MCSVACTCKLVQPSSCFNLSVADLHTVPKQHKWCWLLLLVEAPARILIFCDGDGREIFPHWKCIRQSEKVETQHCIHIHSSWCLTLEDLSSSSSVLALLWNVCQPCLSQGQLCTVLFYFRKMFHPPKESQTISLWGICNACWPDQGTDESATAQCV